MNNKKKGCQDYCMDREMALYLAGFYSGISNELQDIKSRINSLELEEDRCKETTEAILILLDDNINKINNMVICICENNDISVVNAFNQLPYNEKYQSGLFSGMTGFGDPRLPYLYPQYFGFHGIAPDDIKEEE